MFFAWSVFTVCAFSVCFQESIFDSPCVPGLQLSVPSSELPPPRRRPNMVSEGNVCVVLLLTDITREFWWFKSTYVADGKILHPLWQSQSHGLLTIRISDALFQLYPSWYWFSLVTWQYRVPQDITDQILVISLHSHNCCALIWVFQDIQSLTSAVHGLS